MIKKLVKLAAAGMIVGAATAQAAVVTLDFDTAATGSNLIASPLVTAAGTVTLSGSGLFSYISAVPGAGRSLYYSQSGSDANRALLSFDFDLASVTFDYLGYSIGAFLAEALDINGNVVASFTDSETGCAACFDGQNVVLKGVGIRAFRFADTPGTTNEAAVDNLRLDVPALGNPAPEPGTLALLGLGLAGFVVNRRRSAR